MTTTIEYTNRLIYEKSPYLLQHAHNPVDWYPWGQEAFQKAKIENKPIFLSVGYSTCHWCHVMEHESFENEGIADIMNRSFVNIKVDREENPGVDKFYMTYVQLSSGTSGWPMSVFLTPDLNPFFGGTYFPPGDQCGKPGLITLLNRVAQLWENDPGKVKASGESMTMQMKSYLQAAPTDQTIMDPMVVADETYHHFKDSFDAINGGFGPAPKFPTPVQLQFLLDYYMLNRTNRNKIDDAEKAKDMALFTLNKIALGGIYDHVGNGFHRYSTDDQWHVPHFEKMLPDQAQLLSLYSVAYQITNDIKYADIAKGIIQYVSRDLAHEDGGFYSAEDADSLPTESASKAAEGAFYVWEVSELQDILGLVNSHVFSIHYNCKEEGNVDFDQENDLYRKNVLFKNKTIEETATVAGMTADEVQSILENGISKIYEYRSKVRPKPHRDEKIITGWNGLMVTGLVHAYGALEDPSILDLAVKTVDFMYNNLYDSSTHILFRNYCHGPSLKEAFIDDYSYLVQGLIDLYEVTFDERWIQWAYDLQSKQNQLFYDTEQGGYFHVSKDDDSIPIRMKEDQDGAEPSPNAISVKNLTRLSALLASSSFQYMARQTIESFKSSLTKYPFGLPAFVSSLMIANNGLTQIVLAGEANLSEFQKTISRAFIPNKLVALAIPNEFIASRNSVIQQIAEVQLANPRTTAAYICDGFSCILPIYHIEQLKQTLLT